MAHPLREPTAPERMGLAGLSNMMSACLTNPIDVVKVRMQLSGIGSSARPPSFYESGAALLRAEGPMGLYRGLLPSLLREGSYSTMRLGLYEPTKKLLGATDPANTPLYLKVASGATTGCIGAALAVPTDLVKVRMQGCTATPPKYSNGSTVAAFADIFRQEGGVRALYRGTAPTVQRGALLTGTQIPTYDHTKQTLKQWGVFEEGVPLHFVCCMFAGVCAAGVTSPVDVIKTRMMTDPSIAGVGAAIAAVVRTEGLAGLYKGFTPNWLRLGPHTMFALLFFEQFRAALGMTPV